MLSALELSVSVLAWSALVSSVLRLDSLAVPSPAKLSPVEDTAAATAVATDTATGAATGVATDTMAVVATDTVATSNYDFFIKI